MSNAKRRRPQPSPFGSTLVVSLGEGDGALHSRLQKDVLDGRFEENPALLISATSPLVF